MAHALVFGGTGFIGSHLVSALLDRGDEVVVFARSKPAASRNRLTYHLGDITRYADVQAAVLTHRPAYVFNCAGALTRGRHEISLDESVAVNERGAKHIIDAVVASHTSAPITAGVMLGTSMEYGLTPPVLREDAPAEPAGPYAEAKYRATCYTMEQAKTHGLPVVSARVFTPYGTGMAPGSLVANVCARAVANQPIHLTDPTVTRDFIYIDDLLSLLLALCAVAPEQSGEVFNCGSGRATTLQEFADTVLSVTASSSQLIWEPERRSVYDERRWEADMTKTLGAIAWRPVTTLCRGIAQLGFVRKLL